jgi:hypothetical protein
MYEGRSSQENPELVVPSLLRQTFTAAGQADMSRITPRTLYERKVWIVS